MVVFLYLVSMSLDWDWFDWTDSSGISQSVTEPTERGDDWMSGWK